jgi:hypothetical protein
VARDNNNDDDEEEVLTKLFLEKGVESETNVVDPPAGVAGVVVLAVVRPTTP